MTKRKVYKDKLLHINHPMDLSTYNDFFVMSDLERYLNRHLNRLFERDRFDLSDYVRTHPTDVIEYNDKYELVIDAPGYTSNDIVIEQTTDYITIKGKKAKSSGNHADGGKMHRNERMISSFSRSFRLPQNVVAETIAAKLTDGVLVVSLPKNTNLNKEGVRSIPVS